MDYLEDPIWEEGLKEVEKNPDSYISLEPMDSREAFGLMASFAEEEVTDKKLQDRLFDALNAKGPFQNFKWIIDHSGEYRQKWFDYRDKQYKEYVRREINMATGAFGWGEEE